jgi:MFS family permease
MFIAGVAGFGAMSLVAGASTSDTMLAVARLAQGVAAGLLNPQVSGLIQQLFSGAERGKAFGIFGATIGVATAIGPLAGGAIIALAGPSGGWRWVFWLNVPVAIVVIPLARRLLPAKPAVARPPRLDLPGILLIGLGTMAFMIPFVLAGENGTVLGPNLWWAAGAVALVPVVYFWERAYQRRHSAAVLDPALLRNPGFLYGAGVGLVFFAGFTGIFLLVTLVLQDGLGFTALQAGLVGTPFALGSGFTALNSGRWVARHGRKTVVAGLAVAIVGLVATDAVLRWAPGASPRCPARIASCAPTPTSSSSSTSSPTS